MDIAAAARSVAFRHVKCIQQDSGFCAETFQRVEERLRSYGGLGKGQGLAKTRIDYKNVGQGEEKLHRKKSFYFADLIHLLGYRK